MRLHVIQAVFSRNVKQYFSGVLGYLFLIVFVFLCALLAFGRQFFADNLATLDQLSAQFPILLLFFVPAITMTVWAEEKRQGTDAILFTLPASDLEILLGKYFAVSAVYSTALLFSLTQVYALSLIGAPDYGVIFTTYIGYWLAGLALLAIGMFASSLTSSTTVAFVVGSILCAIPAGLLPSLRGVKVANLFVSVLPGVEMSSIANWSGLVYLEALGIHWNLQDFAIGLIPLANIVYFVSIIVFMLYLNLIVISKRHWSRGQTVSKGGHFLVRIVCLAVALLSLNFVVGKASSSLLARLDLTAEQLYSLDDATIETLAKAKASDRPITIQAFISSEVPRKYVNTKKQFTGLLRQYKLYGGSNVDIRFVEVTPNSETERQAKQLGLEPQADRSDVGGKIVEQDVYLGALVSSAAGDVTLPFVDDDASIEYELTHAIATTSDKDRKITLGIVDTDTFFAGPEINGQRIPWSYNQTFRALKTQFRIKHLSQDDLGELATPDADASPETPDDAKTVRTPPDVLIVPAPSSLTDAASAALVKYMEAGNPTILLADPMPFYWTTRNPMAIGVLNAPKQNRISPQSQYAQVLASAMGPKSSGGQCTQITEALGINWDNGACAWNLDNPHPKFRGAWPVYLGDSWPESYGRYEKAFVFARSTADHNAFSETDPISNGLNEVLFFYPGAISKSTDGKTEFTPLVKLDAKSGLTSWSDLTYTPTQSVPRMDRRTGRRTVEEERAQSQLTNEDLILLRPARQAFLDLDEQEHVVAAHIKGTDSSQLNVVFIADLDFLTDWYHEQQRDIETPLDNIGLLQNAIDVLAGDEQFVALRNRRPIPRSLTMVEDRIKSFRADRALEQEKIEKSTRDELKTAQDKLNEATQEIGENQSLNIFEKLQQSSQVASQAQRRFEIKKEKLDGELKLELDRLEALEQQQTSRLESSLSGLSIGMAILPALLLGSFVLLVRTLNERRLVNPNRRAD